MPPYLFAGSVPKPIPAQECNVVPLIFTEAIPVAAVMASVCPTALLPPNASTICRSRTDFPVPEKRLHDESDRHGKGLLKLALTSGACEKYGLA